MPIKVLLTATVHFKLMVVEEGTAYAYMLVYRIVRGVGGRKKQMHRTTLNENKNISAVHILNIKSGGNGRVGRKVSTIFHFVGVLRRNEHEKKYNYDSCETG